MGKVTKAEYEDAMKSVQKFDTADHELLMSIFIMFDVSGEGIILYRDIVAGIAGCLVSGPVTEKLRSACLVFNIVDNSPAVTKTDMRKILTSINNVASYFGDPVVETTEIEGCAADAFADCESPVAALPYDDVILSVMNHKSFEKFTDGRGTVRFGR